MGNSTVCRPCCGTELSGRHMLLRDKYKILLKESQFKNTCIRILDSTFKQDMELEGEQYLRKSIAVGSNHYESNYLQNSMLTQDSVGWGRNSRKTSVDSEEDHSSSATGVHSQGEKHQERKDVYLLNLIKQSYLFVDLSECMEENKSSAHYQSLLKHQLLKDQQSLCQSFAPQSSPLEQMEWALRLRDETDMMCELEGHVRFCRKVKHDFAPQNDRFLGKLSVNLQGDIMGVYRSKRMGNNQQLLMELREDIDEALGVLGMTIQTLYSIKINQAQASPTTLDLCNEVNIHSMLTCLFFENSAIYDFVMDKIKECFHDRFNKFANQQDYSINEMIDDLISLTSKESRVVEKAQRSYVEALFDPVKNKYSRIGHPFAQSRKILPKIYDKPGPLYKLKIVYEFHKKMNKELQVLRQQLHTIYSISLPSVINRQIQLLIIKWIINQQRHSIDRLGSELLFTEYFIHRLYRMDHKGSCLTTFIQQIERIIQWRQP